MSQRTQSYRLLTGPGLLLVGLLALSGCQSAEQQAQTHYQHGVELLAQGDLVKASLELRQALQLKSDLVPAIYSLATLLERQANFQDAAAEFRDVSERDKTHLDARLHLGRILLAANQLDDAQKYADEAYGLAATNPEVLALKAAVAFKVGNRFDAIRFGEAALSAAPSNLDAILVLAAERLAAADPRGALQFLDKAPAGNGGNLSLQLFRIAAFQALGDDQGIENSFKGLVAVNPTDTNIRDSLARWYLSKGRADDAERALRDFASANPKNIQALLTLVDFLRQQKGSDAARAELQARIALGGDTFALRQALAQLSFADGKYADAADLLNKLIAEAPTPANKTAAQVLLARMMLAQKDWTGAGKLADTVLAGDAKNADALSVRASARVANLKYEDAITDLVAALNQSPLSSPLLLQLADAYERFGKTELADEQYGKAVRNDPANAAVALSYAQFLLRYNRADQAERVLTSFVAQVPTNAQALGLLAQLKLNKGDWVGAQDVATALKRLNDDPDQRNADQILATALTGQQKYDESIKLLQTSGANTDATPLALLVRTYVLAGKQDVALQFVKSVIASNPQNPTARVLLGSLYLLNKQPADAEATYRAGIAANPDDPLAYGALAQLLLSTARTGEAEPILRQGLQHQPKDATLQLLLASLLEHTGKYDDAIVVYEAMYAADPRATIPANNLASLLSDYRSDPVSLDRALQVASRFRTTDVPQFQDTLGWIYYLKGDNAQALTLLKAAADHLPTVGAVQYHLGMAYKALGQKKQAADSLQKAVAAATAQAFPQQDKAKAALAQLTETP